MGESIYWHSDNYHDKIKTADWMITSYSCRNWYDGAVRETIWEKVLSNSFNLQVS